MLNVTGLKFLNNFYLFKKNDKSFLFLSSGYEIITYELDKKHQAIDRKEYN